MIENELKTEQRPAVRLGIVGGDLRALGISWPKWCAAQHFVTSHNSRSTNRTLEAALRSGKLDALIILTRWSGNDVRAMVRKVATCPVRYWDRGLDALKDQLETVVGDDVFGSLLQKELKEREKQQRREHEEQEREQKLKETAVEKKIEIAMPAPQSVTSIRTLNPLPPLPVVPPSAPTGDTRAPTALIVRGGTWHESEIEALILAHETCEGRGTTLVKNYRTLMPTSQRTSTGLAAKLKELYGDRRLTITAALIAAVKYVDKYTKQKEPTLQTPRGSAGEWAAIDTLSQIIGKSQGWISKQKAEGNIRSRRLPGQLTEYSSADAIRLAQATDGGHHLHKATRVADQPVDTHYPPMMLPLLPPVAPSPPPVPVVVPMPSVASMLLSDTPDKNIIARIRYILLGVEVGEKTGTEALAAIAKLVQQ